MISQKFQESSIIVILKNFWNFFYLGASTPKTISAMLLWGS